MEALLIFTNLPDPASAEALAAHLIDRRLAACVTILPAAQSVYRWQGNIERATEVPLLIKASAAAYPALEAAIRERHPYELPEIIAVPVACGLPAYLDWVVAECDAPPPDAIPC
jgi:periplasmic divalent cation tolerance protein